MTTVVPLVLLQKVAWQNGHGHVGICVEQQTWLKNHSVQWLFDMPGQLSDAVQLVAREFSS